MVYGCPNKFVKYTVFAVNFLVFVVGAAIFGVSLAVRYSNAVQRNIQELVDKANVQVDIQTMYIPLYVLAAIGGLLLVTGFLGCCGACCENTCLLGLFFTIILILFIAELACGIAILVKKNWVKEEIIFKGIDEAIEVYNHNKTEDVKNAILNLQKEFDCCGCKGPDDYKGVAPLEPCGKTNDGCCEKIWNKVESKLGIVAGVALGILVIEILAMVFTCLLCNAFKRGEYQYA